MNLGDILSIFRTLNRFCNLKPLLPLLEYEPFWMVFLIHIETTKTIEERMILFIISIQGMEYLNVTFSTAIS